MLLQLFVNACIRVASLNYLQKHLSLSFLTRLTQRTHVNIIQPPYKQGGALEMVARKLNRLITEHPTLIRSKDGARSHHQTHHRPVLVIMDHNMDLITPVQHASTY